LLYQKPLSLRNDRSKNLNLSDHFLRENMAIAVYEK